MKGASFDHDGKAWLVTGGAGYIGGHVVRVLRDAGYRVVVLDDLSSGLLRRVPDDVPLVKASVLDGVALRSTMRDFEVGGVVHLAAKKAPAESVSRPLYYLRENVGGLEQLLAAMTEMSVLHVVYSSSAAVYGSPTAQLVTEDELTRPINPYGRTKLIGEWLLQDVAAVTPLRWIGLRYFNVAGTAAPELADTGLANLIPLTLRALAQGHRPQIFGTDYPTRDGTCVRDYVHVSDLAEAHLVAVRRTEQGSCGQVYNVGTGTGASVKQVVSTAERISGRAPGYDVVARRLGDPPQVVASAERIAADLGWRARRDLDDMIRSAWDAQRADALPP